MPHSGRADHRPGADGPRRGLLRHRRGDRPGDRVAEAERLAGLLKAVADPARLRLLSLVARSAGGEACICDLTAPVGLSQPTVSHHMRVLVDAGLLAREQRGRWAYYRLVAGAAEALAAALLAPPRQQ